MGQNKMEKDFRNKLNQREITPSANAWDRLDAMLTVAEEKKPKRDYGWMYMAAGILGFLFIGTVFFSQAEEMIDVRRNVVIENNQPSKGMDNSINEIVTETKSETIAAVTEPKIKIKNNQNQPHTIINDHIQIQQANKNPELIAEVNQTTTNRSAAEQNIINQKAEQVAPAKVDELLANATTPKTAKSTVKVNSRSLLSQVDGEINLTFREKILRKVGKNYQEVAEAVSTRNNQE